MAEERDVMSARKEKIYSKIVNFTSEDFNEHFAESGKFELKLTVVRQIYS